MTKTRIMKKIIKSDEGDDDYEPMTLPNGELMLEDGTTLGNKEYKIYYKQRFHINKYQELQKEHKIRNKEREDKGSCPDK